MHLGARDGGGHLPRPGGRGHLCSVRPSGPRFPMRCCRLRLAWPTTTAGSWQRWPGRRASARSSTRAAICAAPLIGCPRGGCWRRHRGYRSPIPAVRTRFLGAGDLAKLPDGTFSDVPSPTAALRACAFPPTSQEYDLRLLLDHRDNGGSLARASARPAPAGRSSLRQRCCASGEAPRSRASTGTSQGATSPTRQAADRPSQPRSSRRGRPALMVTSCVTCSASSPLISRNGNCGSRRWSEATSSTRSWTGSSARSWRPVHRIRPLAGGSTSAGASPRSPPRCSRSARGRGAWVSGSSGNPSAAGSAVSCWRSSTLSRGGAEPSAACRGRPRRASACRPGRARRESRPPVEVPLGDGRTIRLRGAVDRIDIAEPGHLVVIDYKTGRRNPYRRLGETPWAIYAGAGRKRDPEA